MKELLKLQGGYRRVIDHLLNLQTECLTLGNSMFGALGVDMVLSGCVVTDNGNGTINIGPGLVYVSGDSIRFDGAANIPSDGTKAFVKGAYTATDNKLFGDGNFKNVYREAKAEIADFTGVTQIQIRPELYTLKTYIEDKVAGYAFKGEIKDIYDFDGTFLDNFDASGLGITSRYIGWALFNGNNGGPDGQGRVRITAGTIVSNGIQYDYANGGVGGEAKHKLIIQEMPIHRLAVNNVLRGISRSAAKGDLRNSVDPSNGFTDYIGGDQAHENRQDYVAVYTIIRIV